MYPFVLRVHLWDQHSRVPNFEDQEPNDKQRADLIGGVLRIERELPTFQSE